MSRGIWVRPASLKRLDTAWEPPQGFVEIKPGVWEPEHHVPTPWELQAPVVDTPEAAIREYVRCDRSLPYFAFHHAWSLHVDDPSGVPQWRKFPRYPFLIRFFHAVQQPENVHVEKSRQMLMSWAWMVVFLWDITFRKNWGNMVLSRRKTEVDDGGLVSTHDSLLGKIRHVHMALPAYLQAPLDFHFMVVRHTAAGSYVRGETGTRSAGRSRATKRALMDEAAWLEHSESIFKGIRQAAKGGTILTSTPNGKGNVFARIRFKAHTTFRKLRFHWIEHPEKARGLYCTCGWRMEDASDAPPHTQFEAHDCQNRLLDPPQGPDPRSPWYDREVLDMTPEGVASELDISYEKSRRGRVFGAFDSTRQVFEYQSVVGAQGEDEPLEAYRARYLRAVIEPSRPCVVGWDFGVSDPTSIVLGQVMDESLMEIRWIDELEESDKGWEFYHTFVTTFWAPIVRERTGFDLIHYGDPSGKSRQSDLMSWVKNLASREPRIVIIHLPKRGSLLEWIDFVHMIIRHDNFSVSSWASNLIDALGNYHYPTDEQGNLVPGKQEPVHDAFSHVMSAMRYVYQFRWWFRLMNVDKHIVSNSAVMAAKDDTPVLPQPPVDSRGLRYFSNR